MAELYRSNHTGAISTVISENLPQDSVVISDANGKLATSSTVSSTELAALDGVTSNIQTQINAKANTSSLATVATSGSYNDLTNKPTIPTGSDYVLKTTTGGSVISATGLTNIKSTGSILKLESYANNTNHPKIDMQNYKIAMSMTNADDDISSFELGDVVKTISVDDYVVNSGASIYQTCGDYELTASGGVSAISASDVTLQTEGKVVVKDKDEKYFISVGKQTIGSVTNPLIKLDDSNGEAFTQITNNKIRVADDSSSHSYNIQLTPTSIAANSTNHGATDEDWYSKLEDDTIGVYKGSSSKAELTSTSFTTNNSATTPYALTSNTGFSVTGGLTVDGTSFSDLATTTSLADYVKKSNSGDVTIVANSDNDERSILTLNNTSARLTNERGATIKVGDDERNNNIQLSATNKIKLEGTQGTHVANTLYASHIVSDSSMDDELKLEGYYVTIKSVNDGIDLITAGDSGVTLKYNYNATENGKIVVADGGIKLIDSKNGTSITGGLTVDGTTFKSVKDSVDTLNGSKTTQGSVAYQIAQVVADAPASYDTLKEIADWITNDTTGAAKMANDISELKGVVSDDGSSVEFKGYDDGYLSIDKNDGNFVLKGNSDSEIECAGSIGISADGITLTSNSSSDVEISADGYMYLHSENGVSITDKGDNGITLESYTCNTKHPKITMDENSININNNLGAQVRVGYDNTTKENIDLLATGKIYLESGYNMSSTGGGIKLYDATNDGIKLESNDGGYLNVCGNEIELANNSDGDSDIKISDDGVEINSANGITMKSADASVYIESYSSNTNHPKIEMGEDSIVINNGNNTTVSIGSNFEISSSTDDGLKSIDLVGSNIEIKNTDQNIDIESTYGEVNLLAPQISIQSSQNSGDFAIYADGDGIKLQRQTGTSAAYIDLGWERCDPYIDIVAPQGTSITGGLTTDTLKIGNTTITEAQLKNLLSLTDGDEVSY